MKSIICAVFFIVLCLSATGQNQASDYVTTPVNKKVKEFADRFDLSSPLRSEVTFSYININGKDGLLRKASSRKYKYAFPDSTAKDSEVPPSFREFILNTTIKEVMVYKDSLACTISLQPDSSYDIRKFALEKGKWVNFGDDGKSTLQESRDHFKKYAGENLNQLRKLSAINHFPTDTLAFVNYLKTNSEDPIRFLLEKLEKNKLVIYGEIHRRTASWDFCTRLVPDPRFAENTGIIFMEMEANEQPQIDSFLTKTILDKELLLNIFRDYMPNGWDDRGRFDFLVSVWQLNQKLPASRKIRVIFVDTPRIYTEEGVKNEIQDRNGFMAGKILECIQTSKDTRHALFIVGSAHVYRTGETAGAILYRKLNGNVYTVFTHCPVSDDNMDIPERIRKGMFDYAFYKNGDKPVAFELKNSPFGKEPFDGLYLDGSGCFQDNYEGYLFFGSLDKEKSPDILKEMYDDKFIHEIDRRFHLMGWNLIKDWGLRELSVEAVLDFVRKDNTPFKWQYLKPLVSGK